MRKRIIDSFIFFNELDLLELRLKQHDEHVDSFLICEATKTFRGKPKKLFFEENKKRFSAYLHKIRHVVVDDLPERVDLDEEGAAWEREYHQRRRLRLAEDGAENQDVLIISDCDEIISREAFLSMRARNGYFMLDMPMFQFYVNMAASPSGWNKVFAYSAKGRHHIGDYNQIRINPVAHFNAIECERHLLGDAGWHFTYLGGRERVAEKLNAYSHMSGWQSRFAEADQLTKQMQILRVVGGDRPLRWVPVDSEMPEPLVAMSSEWERLGYIKTAASRIAELQLLYSEAEDRIDRCTKETQFLSRSQSDGNLLRDSEDCLFDFSGRQKIVRASEHASIQHETTSQDHPVIEFARFVPGRRYTISCNVEGAEHPLLSASNFTIQDSGVDHGRYYISGDAKAEDENISIYLRSNDDLTWNSSAWQIERGSSPTPYKATRSFDLLGHEGEFSWCDGMQVGREASSPDPCFEKEHRVDVDAADTNAGYYTVGNITPHQKYDAFCEVMLISGNCKEIVLSLGEWLGQQRSPGDPSLMRVWQKVRVRCRAPRDTGNTAHLVLRIGAASKSIVRSRNWRLVEVGE